MIIRDYFVVPIGVGRFLEQEVRDERAAGGGKRYALLHNKSATFFTHFLLPKYTPSSVLQFTESPIKKCEGVDLTPPHF